MTESALVKYDEAVRALAECVRVDEAKAWQDKAAAYQAWARQAKDERLLAYATEIRLRAQRKVGELLIQMKERGERSMGGGNGKPPGKSKTAKRRQRLKAEAADTMSEVIVLPTLKDLGIEAKQATRWQQLARTSAAEFEERVAVATGKKERPRHEKNAKAGTPRKTRVAKARGKEPSIKQQVNAFHHEAVSIVSDFRDRFLPWFGANAKLTSEQRAVLIEAMNLCSTEFHKLAQAIDGR